MDAISSSSARPGDDSLYKLLKLCHQLHTGSDEELQNQVGRLGGAQSEEMMEAVRLLVHSSVCIQQQEVLALLAKGRTMPRISEKLFISPATVNNHCARMREKLGIRGRHALLNFAITGTAS